jgi:hypothetical protein
VEDTLRMGVAHVRVPRARLWGRVSAVPWNSHYHAAVGS